jgi:hypothetical protein
MADAVFISRHIPALCDVTSALQMFLLLLTDIHVSMQSVRACDCE